MVPGSLRDHGTANTLMLDFWLPELRDNEFLASLWNFIMAAAGNQYMLYHDLFVHVAQAYRFWNPKPIGFKVIGLQGESQDQT